MMLHWPRLLSRLSNTLCPGRSEADLTREITAHLGLLDEEHRRRGLDAIDAQAAAKRAFGSTAWTADAHRDARAFGWMMDVRRDCGYAFRSFRRSPSVSLTIVLSLAVGIGVNALAFSVFNGVLFRAQVGRDSASFVRVYLKSSGPSPRTIYGNRYRGTLEDFDAIRSRSQTLSAVTVSTPATFALDGGEVPTLRGQLVSCNYIAVHHWPALKGRTFNDTDCLAPGAEAVAVLSERGWSVGFGGDPDIVGGTVRLNNRLVTIVGVIPDNLVGEPLLPLVYVPYTMQPALLSGNHFRDSPGSLAWLDVAGRLRNGATAAEAERELSVIMSTLDRQHSGRLTDVVVNNGALIRAPGLANAAALIIALALGSTALVLLLVCTNVTMLLLARAMARQPEIGVRLSVGCGRSRLVRQLLSETLVLASAASTIGLAVASVFARPIVQMLTPFPIGAAFRPDWRVVGYTIGIALAATVIAGLSPALASAQFAPVGALKLRRSDMGARATQPHRSTLIANHISITVILLVATFVLVRAQDRLVRPRLDYDPAAVVVASIDLTRAGYSVGMVRGFYDGFLARLQTTPGISAVALSSSPPFMGTSSMAVTADRQDTLFASWRAVSPDYFRVMGVRIVQGRVFSERVGQSHDRDVPVMVSESLARRLSSQRAVLGQRLRLGNGAIGEVVAVTADTQSIRVGESDGPVVYQAMSQADLTNASVLLSVSADPRALMGTIPALIRTIDPDLQVMPETISTIIERAASQYGAVIRAAALSSLLAVALSFAGLYGIMTFAATRRTREMGLRLALGAPRRAVVGLFMRSLWRPVLRGLATGLPLSAAVAMMLQRSSLVGGVSPSEPWPYAAAILVVVTVATSATLIPAISVSRTQPMMALRNE